MRVQLVQKEALSKEARNAYENHAEAKSLTNMKKALLLDFATYEAYMGWYKSWGRLVEIIGKKSAMIYAHSISSTNDCLLCSLFFISDLKAIGVDPNALVLDEKETLLSELGKQIVKDPTAVSDELIGQLKSFFSDSELVSIVGFAGQMIATNNFNSVLQTDVDQRLVPMLDEFKRATWRESIK